MEQPLFDHAALLARVDGDEELLRELIDLFLEDCPRLLTAIREAIARQDRDLLKRAAHTLKGSVGNFGAKAVCELAQKLESLAPDLDLGAAGQLSQKLEGMVGSLEQSLSRLAGSQCIMS
jgi:HPt (histidine-containing phosphotransfer) domain-containing protein